MAVVGGEEAEIQRLARPQNGLITARQLSATGLTRSAVRAGVKRGRLMHVGYGIYAVADPLLLPLARETAILLSLGDAAVLSHRSAAALWEVASPDAVTVDVTLVGRKSRPRPGVTIHRVCRLHPLDIRTISNLRVTAPARTMIDFAAGATGSELEGAFGEARAKRLLTEKDLDAALSRAPRNHPGAAIIRTRLHDDAGSTYTRSKAERRLRRVLAAAELPQPIVNRRLNGFTVDFLWPQERVILEVDGYGTHGHRLAFEQDRRRDQVQIAAGYVVIRVTWRQLRDEPMPVVARIAQALARRAA